MSRTALVTGGSSGIGLALSHRLAQRGYRLLWVSLDAEELAAAAAQLETATPNVQIETLALNLSAPNAPQRVFDWAQSQGRVDLLVNNAGLGVYGDSADLPIEAEQTMIAVNIGALHALTRLFLGAMGKRGGGRIINIASNSAFTPAPRLAVYAATKAFVKHYGEALQQEIAAAGRPVRLMTVFPAAISDTPFRLRAKMDRVRTFTSFTATTVDEVADDIVKGMDAGRSRVVTGAAMRRAMLLLKLTPGPIVRWMTRRETMML